MNRHYPTIKNTFWLLGLNFLVVMGLVVLLYVIVITTKVVPSNEFSTLMRKYPIWLGLGNIITIGLTIIWGFKKTKTDFHRVFPIQPFSPLILIPIVVSVVGLNILLSDIDNLLRNLFHWQNDDFFVALYQQPVWIQVFILMIVAPFTEEFLFRGLIFTGYLNNYSFKKAIWVSAVWFALFHLNVQQFSGAFIFGVLFAWLVGKTNSLWPAIFAHALTNGLPLFVTKVMQVQIIGYTYQNGARPVFQPLWLDLSALFMILTGFGLFWLLKDQTQKPTELLRPQLPEELTDETKNVRQARFNSHGKVALVIGVITVINFIVILAFLVIQTRHPLSQSNSAIMGSLAILELLGCLTGIGFGIAGLVKRQGRIVTWTGMTLNSLYLFFILLLVVVSVIKK